MLLSKSIMFGGCDCAELECGVFVDEFHPETGAARTYYPFLGCP